jgi:hypothetical protein
VPWFVSDDTPLGVDGTGDVSFGAIVEDVPPVYAGAGAGAVAAGAGAVAAGAGAGAVVAGVAAGVVAAGAAAGAGAAGAGRAGRLYTMPGPVELSGRLENDCGVLSTTSGGGTAGPGAVDSPSGCTVSGAGVGDGGGQAASTNAKHTRSGDMTAGGCERHAAALRELLSSGDAGARTRGRA